MISRSNPGDRLEALSLTPRFLGQSRRFWSESTVQGGVLFALVVLVFSRVAGYPFVNYDDPGYVYANAHVNSGISWSNTLWALTSLNGGISYWHPLTWLSHQLDVQLFGLRAGAHHLTNVWIHIANTLVLLSVLRQLGLSPRSSFFTAGLFAVHPLHVESVAWISERKDVLYAFFWLCSLRRYIEFRQSGRWRLWGSSFLFFGCALMSKPTAVTLPVILLVLETSGIFAVGKIGVVIQRGVIRRSAWIVPFLVLALFCAIAVLVAQVRLGALPSIAQLTLSDRMDNALVSYAVYLGNVVLPRALCASYMRVEAPPLEAVLLATAILIGISIALYGARVRAPLAFVGWLWFVIGLMPNVGFVQAGAQSMADRYTYVPLIGLAIMVVEWPRQWNLPVSHSRFLPLFGGLLLAACGVLSFRQLDHWHDSTALFARALEVNDANWVAHLGLGMALTQERRFGAALLHLETALSLPGNRAETERRLGICYEASGDPVNAVIHFRRAVALASGGNANRLGIADQPENIWP